ncbi:hypothetical protein BCD67_00870 [Oscillatoriales cyanobacterium USR001]|nr:hypothetical protein BCD67_00870 [Oscillatoriales cyanobacterium USR001]
MLPKVNLTRDRALNSYLYSSSHLDPSTTDPAKLRQLIDRLETIAGLQQGFDELNAGQTRPIAQFAQKMQQTYGISS